MLFKIKMARLGLTDSISAGLDYPGGSSHSLFFERMQKEQDILQRQMKKL